MLTILTVTVQNCSICRSVCIVFTEQYLKPRYLRQDYFC